jgi:hypothetical protein
MIYTLHFLGCCRNKTSTINKSRIHAYVMLMPLARTYSISPNYNNFKIYLIYCGSNSITGLDRP